MLYVYMAIFAGAAVALDQFTKWLTVSNIDLFGYVRAWDGMFHFTYVQNRGAAWSSFEGQQWLFALVFALFTAGIIWEFSKKRWPFTTMERWCIAAIYAGGVGNMIDRLCLGYVVDMIQLEFMEFPVFNVADCFITCGGILLVCHLIFFNKEFWKDEKKK